MLERLDAIDWSALSTADGPATAVPHMIRSMASPDPQVRQQGFADAYRTIWHQGAVYTATAPAVSFLLEVARAPNGADRHRVLELLFHLAHGWRYSKCIRRAYGACECVRSASAAVAQGRAVYMALLFDPDLIVRRQAVRMLTCSPDVAPEVISVLRQAARVDTDDGVRASALYAVAMLSANEEAEFIQCALHDAVPLVRLSAALASATFLGAATSDEVVDVLLNFLERSNDIPYDALVFGEDCAADIGLALASIEPSLRPSIVERLIERAESGKVSVMVAAESLLQVAFGHAPFSDEYRCDDLDLAQCTALTFVARCAWIRQADGGWLTFRLFERLLALRGLDDLGRSILECE